MTLGEKIIFQRKQHHMTQEELASRLSITRQAVSKWELDQSQPDLDIIAQLSDLFQVSTDYLIKEGEEKEEKEEVTGSGEAADREEVAGRTLDKAFLITSTHIFAGIILILGLFLLVYGLFFTEEMLVPYIGFIIAVVGTELLFLKIGLIVAWTVWGLFSVLVLFVDVKLILEEGFQHIFSVFNIATIMVLVLLVVLIRITAKNGRISFSRKK